MGLGVNWIDLVYNKAKMNDQFIGRSNRITLEGLLIEFGPIATYVVNDIFAIEGHHNLRLSYMATYYDENSEDYIIWYNFNWLHVGLGARGKFVYIGYEYTFGNVEGKLTRDGEYENIGQFYDNQPMNSKNSKPIIGFQF